MTLKMAWATDLHLDHALANSYEIFIEFVHSQNPDLILISGDTAEQGRCLEWLAAMQRRVRVPLYFILGNHDFYGMVIAEMRKEAQRYTRQCPNVCYLSSEPFIALTSSCALIGQDGWGDGKAGSYFSSSLLLNDHVFIQNFIRLDKQQRYQLLNHLGEESACRVQKQLDEVFRNRFKMAVLLTHVPPFIECCLYDDHMADSDWAPHFVNQSLGVMLKDTMQKYRDRELLVLCGHTHHAAFYAPLPNLSVIVGGTQLRIPMLQACLTLGSDKIFHLETPIFYKRD